MPPNRRVLQTAAAEHGRETSTSGTDSALSLVSSRAVFQKRAADASLIISDFATTSSHLAEATQLRVLNASSAAPSAGSADGAPTMLDLGLSFSHVYSGLPFDFSLQPGLVRLQLGAPDMRGALAAADSAKAAAQVEAAELRAELLRERAKAMALQREMTAARVTHAAHLPRGNEGGLAAPTAVSAASASAKVAARTAAAQASLAAAKGGKGAGGHDHGGAAHGAAGPRAATAQPSGGKGGVGGNGAKGVGANGAKAVGGGGVPAAHRHAPHAHAVPPLKNTAGVNPKNTAGTPRLITRPLAASASSSASIAAAPTAAANAAAAKVAAAAAVNAANAAAAAHGRQLHSHWRKSRYDRRLSRWRPRELSIVGGGNETAGAGPIYLSIYLDLYLSVHLSLSLALCIYMYMHIYVYNYIYVCVCVCVRMP